MWNEVREFSYPPCLLMKPVLRLRLHATQSQPCFLAVLNAFALPGNNLIFTAMPTERITHYTLQAKSCSKGQAPLENPDNKTGWTPRTFLRLMFSPYLLSAAPASWSACSFLVNWPNFLLKNHPAKQIDDNQFEELTPRNEKLQSIKNHIWIILYSMTPTWQEMG